MLSKLADHLINIIADFAVKAAIAEVKSRQSSPSVPSYGEDDPKSEDDEALADIPTSIRNDLPY